MYRDYLLRRLLHMIPVLIGLSILIFVISRVVPGDPVRLALGPEATQEQIEKFRQELGLDKPLHVQYWNWVRGVFRGEFGRSLRTWRDVAKDVRGFLPATIELAAFAMLLAVGLGVPLGVRAALKKDGWEDQLTRVLALSGVALPRFWSGILFQLLFAFVLPIFPVVGRGPSPAMDITGLYTVDALLIGDWGAFFQALRHLFLPAFTLSLPSLAQIMRITRGSMIEQTRKDYILAARSYGLPESLIVYKYMLKNAFTATLTIIGLTFGFLLGGAFLVEVVFSWPGLSQYGTRAVLYKDFNAVVAVTMVIGVAYVAINFIVDMLYAYLDPRIRYGGE